MRQRAGEVDGEPAQPESGEQRDPRQWQGGGPQRGQQCGEGARAEAERERAADCI